MGVTLLKSEIIFIGTGDLNYKFKAFCANLRCKFKAFLHSYTTFLRKFKFKTSFKVLLCQNNRSETSRCELTLPNGPWGVKASLKSPSGPR